MQEQMAEAEARLEKTATEPVEEPDVSLAATESANGSAEYAEETPSAAVAEPASVPEALSASTSAPRRRRANPSEENIWPRHHAICLMGAICDIKLGGYDAAREAADPLKTVKMREVAEAALVFCPWLLNASYLNFVGSAGLERDGLEGCFRSWVSNRVYYFYRDPSEHPYCRKRSNLHAVYGEFYNTFSGDLQSGTVISEDRAKEFWIAVSNRVPFRLPACGMALNVVPVLSSTDATAAPNPAVVVNTEGQEGGAL